MRARPARRFPGVSDPTQTPIVEELEPRALLSTYYVSPAGSDSASGTLTTAPWRTINRVNSQTLKPGDKVLFQGGKTFSGSIYIPSREAGTASSPLVFSSYGSGRATISSGSKRGFDLAQGAGITISNLNFVGNGMYNNTAEGILAHVDWVGKSVSSIKINNVDVSGYGREGILFRAIGGSSINDVRVERVDSHDNLWGGVKAHNDRVSGMRNYVIDHVRAWNIPGDRTRNDVTGNGIFLEGVSGGVINRSLAHDNGRDAPGSVGIWAAMGERYTIQYSETYNQSTRSATDGGGFDFDWNVTNSVMQYNYSHNNAGPGYVLAAGTHTSSGNTVRYNVSQNDGRKNGKAGIQVWGDQRNANIYNNAVYITNTSNPNTAAFFAHNSDSPLPKSIYVYNNIFYSTGGAKVINVTPSVAASSGALFFRGNSYYSGSGSFKMQWGSTTYTSLSAWRNAKGQEKLNGVATGYQGDPKLVAAGQGQIIGNSDNLRALTAYKLQSSSPLINKGVTQPGILAAAIVDFWGDSLPKGGRYDIGVDEVA